MNIESGLAVRPARIFHLLDVNHMVTRQELYGRIASAFPDSDSINRRNDFIDGTVNYTHREGITTEEVAVVLKPAVVRTRLGLICDTLSRLSARKEGKLPEYTIPEVYDAYSVIAANWLSIHGCLGVDGHGRALIRLLPITLNTAGYPYEINYKQFYDLGTGSFDINKSMIAILYLNGHLRAGMRIMAAKKELDQKGKISGVLLDPFIFGDKLTRQAADNYARKVCCGRTL